MSNITATEAAQIASRLIVEKRDGYWRVIDTATNKPFRHTVNANAAFYGDEGYDRATDAHTDLAHWVSMVARTKQQRSDALQGQTFGILPTGR